MKYQDIQNLNSQDFKRFTGIQKSTFEMMLQAWKEYLVGRSNAGRPTKLAKPEQLLVALQYWREYRTYFHIAQDWGIDESTVYRIVRRVETVLIQSGRFRIPGKKGLLKDGENPDVILIDVTETPIERPKKNQKKYYSGKKKQHTIKCQVLAEQNSGKIICLFFGKGAQHDFKLFKISQIQIHPETESIQDSAYQGIKGYHFNSYIPRKKPKLGKLSSLEKEYNRELAKERIGIEHVNCRLKVFKIFAGRYRNRRRRSGLRCNLIAAIHNSEISLAS